MPKLNLISVPAYLETILQWLNRRKETITTEELSNTFRELTYHVSEAHLLHFTTSFSRLAFLINHYNIPPVSAWQYHHLRVTIKKQEQLSSEHLKMAFHVLVNLICDLLDRPYEYHRKDLFPNPKNQPGKSRWASVKGTALCFRENQLIVALESDTFENYTLIHDDKNDHVNTCLQLLKNKCQLPCDIILEHVLLKEHRQIDCSFIIIQPNYLIDISSIANCVESGGMDIEKYLLNKLLPNRQNQSLLLGNVVNLLFDELLFDSNTKLDEFVSRLFSKYALPLSLLDDRTLRGFLEKLHHQYHILLHEYLLKPNTDNIKPENIYIEPSFISPYYGIQGRLDLLLIDESPQIPNQIIELKSGKVFRPNKYGLNHPHYAQTLLYELLTQQALKKYGKSTENYILYSHSELNPLRYAPSTKNMFNDLKDLRNQLVAFEYQNLTVKGWLKSLRAFYQPDKDLKRGFLKDHYDWVKSVLEGLRPFEKDYLLEQLAFLSREQMQNKVGDRMLRKGQSSIWNSSHQDKRENYAILDYLRIVEVQSDQERPSLVLSKTDRTNVLSSFRIGDIVILYPLTTESNIATSPIYKCTISEINQENITLRLRAKQKNPKAFSHPHWCLEGDYFDNALHRNMANLFEFFSQDIRKRDLLLNPTFPSEQAPSVLDQQKSISPDESLFGTTEQMQILKSYFHSKELFLLWGPPGSGKTSIILHQIIAQIWKNSQQNILVVAYTNRAVDEICDAILRIQEVGQDFIRIGSEQSTSPHLKALLLQNKVKHIRNRKSFRALINSCRIIVGTLASLDSKKELFQIKKFDRLLVDEASQILDAQLLALASKVNHLTLIGDHHQLPAVVAQSEQSISYASNQLRKLHFESLAESLFSRLLGQLQSSNSSNHYAMLQHQGRMHEDICRFVSSEFYNEKLDILPPDIPRGTEQRAPLERKSAPPYDEQGMSLLHSKRFIFVDSCEPEAFIISKSSNREAQIIKHILDHFEKILPENSWDEIGIITPFKAQIATIRQTLSSSAHESIKIDTVERYQGGAKDIIILSLAVNSQISLRLITNTNADNIDRKLNVALSRAREQVIVIGNQKVLISNPNYKRLIEYADHLTISE